MSSKSDKHIPTHEELLQEIQLRTPKIANCLGVKHAVIKGGPQSYKVASLMEFADATSGESAHHELRLNSYAYRAGKGFDFEGRPVRWTCRDGEIERLRIFLETYQGVTAPGSHKVVPADVADRIEPFLNSLANVDLSTPQLLEIVAALAARASDLRSLPELGESNTLRMAAAAIRVAHRTHALNRLVTLIEADALEQQFQELLSQNWWMLGGHYVELIPRRHWTPEETIDIMLRAATNCLEIVELKRASAQLFKFDHGHWIMSSVVNDAMNQAAHYLTEIEKNQSYLLDRYKVDLYRLRAKVLIGTIREDEDDIELKRLALRMYNSHLHGIEIITYDQLVATVENVISSNAGESGQEGDVSSDEIPF